MHMPELCYNNSGWAKELFWEDFDQENSVGSSIFFSAHKKQEVSTEMDSGKGDNYSIHTDGNVVCKK